MALNQNQFAQTGIVGMIDMRFPYNTVSVQIDASQATPLVAGQAVKVVDSAGGVPKVVGCAANADEVFGFINFDIKTVSFVAGSLAEISMSGNVIYLNATTAIPRGAQVTLDVSVAASVGVMVPASGKRIVGFAYDKAAGSGSLIRVVVKSPTFTLA